MSAITGEASIPEIEPETAPGLWYHIKAGLVVSFWFTVLGRFQIMGVCKT